RRERLDRDRIAEALGDLPLHASTVRKPDREEHAVPLGADLLRIAHALAADEAHDARIAPQGRRLVFVMELVAALIEPAARSNVARRLASRAPSAPRHGLLPLLLGLGSER